MFSTPLIVFICWSFLLFPLQSAVSSIIFSLAKISGVTVSLSAPITLSLLSKSGEHVLINIDWQCTGILSMTLFLALTMATPHVEYKEKAKALLIGEPVFFLLNLLRLYVTILCGFHYGLKTMNLLHKIIWEAVAPVIVVAAWTVWLYFLRNRARNRCTDAKQAS